MRERWLLAGSHDDTATIRWLHKCARAREDVLVVAPTPGRGGEGIARDVLRAMGKRFDLPRTPRDPATLLARADLWLRASRITTLIVRDAQRLAADAWRHVTAIGLEHAALWLLADPAELTTSHHDASQDLTIKPGSLDQLRARIESPTAPACWATRLAEQTPTPIAPDVDYASFAVASQALGREPLFANFILGRDHADWYLRHVTRQPGQHEINELLTAVAHCAADREAAIARVRGAQAQLLLAGIHTSIGAGELRARLASRDLSPPSANAARLLRSYVEPGPAAAVAACLATGRGPGWLAQITHAQLQEGRIANHRVPATLRSTLRVLLQDTRRSGPVFTSTNADGIAIQRILDAAIRHTGLRLNRSREPLISQPTWATVTRVW
jgi:hypothetical protein